jgi:putative transposon-encoded protein
MKKKIEARFLANQMLKDDIEISFKKRIKDSTQVNPS